MTLSHTSGLTQTQMQELHEKYMKAQMLAQQSHQAHTQAHLAAQQQSHTGGLLGGQNSLRQPAQTWGAQNAYQKQEQTKLDEGAWDVAVSQLIDLWIVRHGSKWVKRDELDDFYIVAAQRLQRLNKIEEHYVNGTNVYRIVE